MDWTVATLLRASPSWQERPVMGLLDAWASSPVGLLLSQLEGDQLADAQSGSEILSTLH